jgi:hypothetical protein
VRIDEEGITYREVLTTVQASWEEIQAIHIYEASRGSNMMTIRISIRGQDGIVKTRHNIRRSGSLLEPLSQTLRAYKPDLVVMMNQLRSDTRTIAAVGQERGKGSGTILICLLLVLAMIGTMFGSLVVGLTAFVGVSGLEQEVLLDDVSSFHHSLVLAKLSFSFAGIGMGLILLPECCTCCFQKDLLLKVMFFGMPFFQLLSCCFAMGSYTTLKNHSSLCGPYYVELPYARYNKSIDGTDVIVHDDIGMTCKFGSDFYWALGLAIVIVLEITTIGVMVVQDKRQIYTPGEAIELSTTVNEDDGEYEGGEDDNDDPFHVGMQELLNITTTTTTTTMLEVKTGEEELVDSNLPRIV